MSALDETTSADPLRALRAQDHRPASEVWKSRIQEWATRRLPTAATRPWFIGALLVPVAIAIGWQSYVATEPPIEASLPLASELSSAIETSQDPPATPSVATDGPVTTSASALVVVHVAGAVEQPGIITAELGWRVDDAIAAAGGALVDADLNRINLAAPLVDGQQVFVPVIGEAVPEVVGRTQPGLAGESGVVDINTAASSDLEVLPGIGPVTAASIVAHRETHGPFANVDALVAVRGIGPATMEQLRVHVRAS